MDYLGRYYTNDAISRLLVNNFEEVNPRKIIDLGVGDASLSVAAYHKWSSAKYYATEIEKTKAAEIEKRLAFIKVYNYDTLHPTASSRLKIKLGSIDIAICNPPYTKVERVKKYAALFKSIGCGDFLKLKRITSEIVFFAHNLKLLKEGGELGIIVSDTLVTGKEYDIFRKTILAKFNVRLVIQLPDNIFSKTEARTHIIFISKSKPVGNCCEVTAASSDGSLSLKLNIEKDRLMVRMDYRFYQANIHNDNGFITLKDIGAIIKRGYFSYKELRGRRLAYFHSVHFKQHSSQIVFTLPVSKKYDSYCAHEGDIIMCRVGKRVVGKAAIVKQGKAVISDCIYRISVPETYRDIVLKSIMSDRGTEWLAAYAHGVCSQVVSKSDLENFPLFTLNENHGKV